MCKFSLVRTKSCVKVVAMIARSLLPFFFEYSPTHLHIRIDFQHLHETECATETKLEEKKKVGHEKLVPQLNCTFDTRHCPEHGCVCLRLQPIDELAGCGRVSVQRACMCVQRVYVRSYACRSLSLSRMHATDKKLDRSSALAFNVRAASV